MDFNSILGALIGAVVGGQKTTNTATATAATDVVVNPQITSINLVDLTPLKDFLTTFTGQQADMQAAQQAETRNFQADLLEKLQIALAGVALVFAIRR